MEGSVFFCKDRDAIRVKGPNEFTVTVKWHTDRSSCDLMLGEEPCPLWQVSKRALEPLFSPALDGNMPRNHERTP